MERSPDERVKSERVWLAAVLVGGALLRAWGLTDHGLWIDEYGTAWTIAGGAGDVFRRATTIHGQSPLYYLVAWASAEVFGPGPFGLRIPSLLFGVGLLALAHPLAMRLFGDRRTAILVVLAFAVNERLVYYSQEARPYGLALLCAAGSFHFFAALLDGGGRRARFGYWATTLLTWYAHYLFGVVILAQGIYVLLMRPWSWGRLRPWWLTFGVLAPLMAPGLLQFWALYGRRGDLDWIEAPPAGVVAGLEAMVGLLDPWCLGALGLGLGFAWLRGGRIVQPGPAARPGLAALWLVVPIGVVVALEPLLGVQLLHVRYLAIAVPAVPLIQGALLGSLRGAPALRAVPVVLFLLVSLVVRIEPLVQRDGGRFWWFVQHDWKGAVEALARNYRPDDLILYRTGFVELDSMVRGQASATTREFVDWPLISHLPAGRSFRRHPLPYRDSAELGSIVAEEIRRAAPRRIWLLGILPEESSDSIDGLVSMATHDSAFQMANGRRFGVVKLVLLRE